MKSCAFALPVFFVLRYVIFLSGLGGLGFTGLSIALPIWALRWWLKYGKISTNDAEFVRARKVVKIVGISASAVLLFLVIAPFLLAVLIGISRR
jgi:hypothetical protein